MSVRKILCIFFIVISPVSVPPKLNQTVYKIKETVLEKENIELRCPVSGIPDPDIVWLVNGQLVEEGSAERNVILAPRGRSVN